MEKYMELEMSGKDSVMQVSIYQIAKNMTLEQFASFMDDFCNSISIDTKSGVSVGKLLHSSHRTLQASVFRFCMGIIMGIGMQEYTDPRNEIAVNTAKKIAKMVETGDLELGYMI